MMTDDSQAAEDESEAQYIRNSYLSSNAYRRRVKIHAVRAQHGLGPDEEEEPMALPGFSGT
jgi:hypothetical protein